VGHASSSAIIALTLGFSALISTGCGAPPGTGAAESGDAPTYDRVGFVDMGRIIRETTVGRQIAARLADAERQVQARLSDLSAQLETIAEDLEAAQAAPVADEERIAELAAEFQATGEEAQQIEAMGRQQLDEYRTELSVPLLQEVREVCETIGREEGYGLIVDRIALSYGDESVDLTDRVIEEVGGSAVSNTLIDEALRETPVRAPEEGLPSAEPADPAGPLDDAAPQ